MQRMICALLLSFVAMLVVSPRVIPVLHRLKFGQTIYDCLLYTSPSPRDS